MIGLSLHRHLNAVRLLMRSTLLPILILFVSTFLLTPAAPAGMVISFGDNGTVQLLPNLAGQQVPFFVSGMDTQINGLEFIIQVEDGGAAMNGTKTGPRITNVDLINGTIFESRTLNQANVHQHDMAWWSTVDTGSGFIANGLIATVTFDTTGISPADYSFRLTDIAGADTRFLMGSEQVFYPQVSPGTLTVVPEPSSFVLVSCLAAAGAYRMRRKRKPAEVASVV